MSSNAAPPPPARRTNSSNYHKRGSSSLKRMPSSENGSAHTSKPTSPNSSINGDRTVKRLRLSRALTIPEGTTVSDACRRMASRRVDAVLLTDSNALLSGIVTDKDVATRVIAEDLKPEETLISTIMTRNPTFVSADALAIEALQKMVQGKFRHLPVVDSGEVIAMLDITKCLYDAISKMEKAAEQGSAIAAAVEGVERQYGNSFSAPQGFLETLKERMFKPALSSIIDDDSKQAIVAPTDTVQAAAKIMQELRTNCVIVVSESKVQGILTSRDILMKVLAANLSPESTLAEKVMTPNPDCAKLDTIILEALHIMHNGKFLHIPVLDKDGSIVACIDVLQLTHAAISMVENSSGALNNVTNVMMQRFWDSAIASEQGDDFDTQSEMSMMLATEAAELGKFPSPRFGRTSSSPRLGNSFSYKFVDNKGRLHRFDHTGSENLDELLATVVKRIGVDDTQQNPYLSYEDDEGDKVVLTCDKDLTGAVAHARSRGQKVLRLHLDFTESCEPAKPELATETVKGRRGRRRKKQTSTKKSYICSMAQATMVMCGFSGQANALKKQPLLLSQIQKIKPDSSISRLFFSPLPLRSSSSSSSFTTFALFKSKTKAPPPKKVVKPKKQVEDGIFGTSGGIGFTKQNELFVGRVAMIGFAASLLGEAITGKGILSQLNIETGIPIYEAEPLLLFFILFTLLGAIGALGDRGQFIDDPPTGLEKAVIPPGKGIKSALGLKEGGPLFGFTKSNELFVGRLAQLGFVFSLIGEIITGKGALAQLNIETGVPIGEIEPLVLFNVAFFFFAALNPGTGKFITDEDED